MSFYFVSTLENPMEELCLLATRQNIDPRKIAEQQFFSDDKMLKSPGELFTRPSSFHLFMNSVPQRTLSEVVYDSKKMPASSTPFGIIIEPSSATAGRRVVFRNSVTGKTFSDSFNKIMSEDQFRDTLKLGNFLETSQSSAIRKILDLRFPPAAQKDKENTLVQKVTQSAASSDTPPTDVSFRYQLKDIDGIYLGNTDKIDKQKIIDAYCFAKAIEEIRHRHEISTKPLVFYYQCRKTNKMVEVPRDVIHRGMGPERKYQYFIDALRVKTEKLIKIYETQVLSAKRLLKLKLPKDIDIVKKSGSRISFFQESSAKQSVGSAVVFNGFNAHERSSNGNSGNWHDEWPNRHNVSQDLSGFSPSKFSPSKSSLSSTPENSPQKPSRGSSSLSTWAIHGNFEKRVSVPPLAAIEPLPGVMPALKESASDYSQSSAFSPQGQPAEMFPTEPLKKETKTAADTSCIAMSPLQPKPPPPTPSSAQVNRRYPSDPFGYQRDARQFLGLLGQTNSEGMTSSKTSSPEKTEESTAKNTQGTARCSDQELCRSYYELVNGGSGSVLLSEALKHLEKACKTLSSEALKHVQEVRENMSEDRHIMGGGLRIDGEKASTVLTSVSATRSSLTSSSVGFRSVASNASSTSSLSQKSSSEAAAIPAVASSSELSQSQGQPQQLSVSRRLFPELGSKPSLPDLTDRFSTNLGADESLTKTRPVMSFARRALSTQQSSQCPPGSIEC